MAHEKSETVKIGNRWFNRTTVGSDKGRILGRKDGFATEAWPVCAGADWQGVA